MAEVRTDLNNHQVYLKFYAKIGSNVLVDVQESGSSCLTRSKNLHSSRYRILRKSIRFFVYVSVVTLYVELNAYLDVSVEGKLCLSSPICRNGLTSTGFLNGQISLTPNVRLSPEGGASLSVAVMFYLSIYIAHSIICMQFVPESR